MSFDNVKPFGIVYSQPVEYSAIAAELWRRDIPISLINPSHLNFDPAERRPEFSLVFNDLSQPSGFRADDSFVRAMILYAKHLESGPLHLAQTRVMNGSNALEVLSSRVRQVSLFASANVRYPKTLIANSLDALVRQLPALRFPVLIKDDNPASQRPTLRFDSITAFIEAVFDERLNPGRDLLVVQEYYQPKTDHIVRVDMLNGNAIASHKVYTWRESSSDWRFEIKAEAFEPSKEIVRSVEEIVRGARIDLASVEYIDDGSGDPVFLNISPFRYSRKHDPEARTLAAIGDYIEKRLRKIREIELAI